MRQKAAEKKAAEAGTQTETPPAEAPKPVKEQTKTLTPEVVKAIKIAKDAQAARKAAPLTSVGVGSEILQEKLIRLFAPECVTRRKIINGKSVRIDPEWHPSFIPKDQTDNHNAMGYEPVTVPKSGALVTSPRGDVLMKCPEWMHQQMLKEVADQAAYLTREPASEEARANPGAVTETLTKG